MEVREAGADTIYDNNDNRSYCTKRNITTSFVRKGPQPKEDGTRAVGASSKTSRQTHGKKLRKPETALRCLAHSRTEQRHRNAATVLRHTHCKCGHFGGA